MKDNSITCDFDIKFVVFPFIIFMTDIHKNGISFIMKFNYFHRFSLPICSIMNPVFVKGIQVFFFNFQVFLHI